VRYLDYCQDVNSCYFPYADCIDHMCDTMRYAGDSCQKNTHCFSNACVKGVCKGLGEGLQCQDGRAQCDKGLFCNRQSNRCQKQNLAGQLCTVNSQVMADSDDVPVVCIPGYVCDATKTLCNPYRTLDPGSACSINAACKTGLSCENSLCKVKSTPTCTDTGNCNPTTPLTQVCECGTDLTARGTCLFVGTNVDCGQQEQEYFDCIQAHDCVHTDKAPWVPGTCAYTHCRCLRATSERCRRQKFPDLYGTVDPEYFGDCGAAPFLTFHSQLRITWPSTLGHLWLSDAAAQSQRCCRPGIDAILTQRCFSVAGITAAMGEVPLQTTVLR